MHKVSLKFHQREVTQKLRKGEQSFFFYATYRLATKKKKKTFNEIFHRVSYLWYAKGQPKISLKGSNSETRKGLLETRAVSRQHSSPGIGVILKYQGVL